MEIVDSLLNGGDATAKIRALQASGHLNNTLKIFAPNFRLSGSVMSVANEPSVAVRPVELVTSVLLMRSSEERLCSESGRGSYTRDH